MAAAMDAARAMAMAVATAAAVAMALAAAIDALRAMALMNVVVVVVTKTVAAMAEARATAAGVLNDNVKHLPMLKDSSKAVPTTKKGNIPFGKADLAAIVLLSVPMSWQNQYNLNHSTVPESTHTLLPDLEAIKQVMVEKKGVNLKAKGKGSTAPSEPKGNPKRKESGGPTG
jgi:hypothetical protein